MSSSHGGSDIDSIGRFANFADALRNCGCCSIGCCCCCIDVVIFVKDVVLLVYMWVVVVVVAAGAKVIDEIFEMASICDKSPSWHSTSNSIVSDKTLSSWSQSRFSENRRCGRKASEMWYKPYIEPILMRKMVVNSHWSDLYLFCIYLCYLTILVGDIFSTTSFAAQNTLRTMTSQKFDGIKASALGRNEYSWIDAASAASVCNCGWWFILLPSVMYMLFVQSR